VSDASEIAVLQLPKFKTDARDLIWTKISKRWPSIWLTTPRQAMWYEVPAALAS